jgi:short-subunit dehydrogenase
MNNTPKSIAVFGAGPGVGRAVARQYGKAGYDVVLVARRQGPLDQFAGELAEHGITAHVVTADLSDLVPALAERIRAKVGDPTAFYYGPATDPKFVDAVDLRAEQLRELMPMTLYTLLALVREFLPAMIESGDGAILSAQGAAAVQGLPRMTGWPPVLAAQRNYLQSLAAEVADRACTSACCTSAHALREPPLRRGSRKRRPRGSRCPTCPPPTRSSWPNCSGPCTPIGNRGKWLSRRVFSAADQSVSRG